MVDPKLLEGGRAVDSGKVECRPALVAVQALFSGNRRESPGTGKSTDAKCAAGNPGVRSVCLANKPDVDIWPGGDRNPTANDHREV